MNLIIVNRENFDSLKGIWHDLLSDDPFISETFEWNKSYIENIDKINEVYTVFSDSDGYILLPLKKIGNEVISLCDHKTDKNFIYLKNEENLYKILKYLSINKIDKVKILNIDEDKGKILKYFEHEIISKVPCPVIDLSKDIDSIISSNLNKNIKRSVKKLNLSHNIESVSIETLKLFLDLNRKWWNERGFPGLASNKQEEDFYLDIIYKSGDKIKFSILFNNEKISSIIMLFEKEDTFSSYGSAHFREYAHYSIGSVHYYFLLNCLQDLGYKFFDFLRGDEEYKYRFGAENKYNVISVLFGDLDQYEK